MTPFARSLAISLLLALPSFAATSAPYLVKDLPGPIDARDSLGSLWITIGNTSWFTADSGDGLGMQVWKTDGTEGGTVRITSVVANGAVGTFIGALGDQLFYGGNDGAGDGLLVIDKDGGTPLALARGHFAERGVIYDGLLYFAAPAREDGGLDKGVELWKTDGTLDGTTFADLRPGPDSSLQSSGTLIVAGDWIFFAGETGAGKGIFRTNGTVAGTTMLMPLAVEPHEAKLAGFGDSAVFILHSGGFNNHQLWITDGTSQADGGTRPFVEGMSNFEARAVLDGRLIFVMQKGGPGIKMWSSDGTFAGTQQLNDHSSSIGAVGIAGAVVGSKYFFFGTDPLTSHNALFTTGAFPGTTQKVIDLETGRLGGTAWNGRFYFANDEAAHGKEWWVSDGTAVGTHIIGDFAAGSRDGAISEQMLVRPDGILVGVDGPLGHEPWIIDGTAEGSRLVKNLAVDTPQPGSNPEKLRSADNRLFFLADAPGYRVVGRSNGQSAGTTTEVITPTDEWWFADAFGSGTRYYLQQPGAALLSTEGTAATTELLSSNAGAAVAFRDGVVYEEKTDNTFRFSDGTAAGTNVIPPLAVSPTTGWKLYAANHQVWFTNGAILAVSDGTAPMRRILPTSTTNSTIREVAEGPDATYFIDEFFEQKRLWRSDSTDEGTQVIAIFAQLPTNFIASSDRLFFTVNDVLWSTNGSSAISLGAPGASVRCVFGTGNAPAVVGNTLYWYVRRNNGTAALWKSNGTVAGTMEVATFPSASQACVSMAAFEGQVYFRGVDAAHGAEPWITDGTASGTHLVADLDPGTSGSDPQEFTVAGTHLFFSAQTPGRGRELWAIGPLGRRRAAGHP